MNDPYRGRIRLGDIYWPIFNQADQTFKLWPFIFSKVIIDGWHYRLLGCRWFIVLFPAGRDSTSAPPAGDK